jgi:hypothetical protein
MAGLGRVQNQSAGQPERWAPPDPMKEALP